MQSLKWNDIKKLREANNSKIRHCSATLTSNQIKSGERTKKSIENLTESKMQKPYSNYWHKIPLTVNDECG